MIWKLILRLIWAILFIKEYRKFQLQLQILIHMTVNN
jgi:hypothetical protein